MPKLLLRLQNPADTTHAQLFPKQAEPREERRTCGQQERCAAVVCGLVRRCPCVQKQVHHAPVARCCRVGAGRQAVLADRLRQRFGGAALAGG